MWFSFQLETKYLEPQHKNDINKLTRPLMAAAVKNETLQQLLDGTFVEKNPEGDCGLFWLLAGNLEHKGVK